MSPKFPMWVPNRAWVGITGIAVSRSWAAAAAAAAGRAAERAGRGSWQGRDGSVSAANSPHDDSQCATATSSDTDKHEWPKENPRSQGFEFHLAHHYQVTGEVTWISLWSSGLTKLYITCGATPSQTTFYPVGIPAVFAVAAAPVYRTGLIASGGLVCQSTCIGINWRSGKQKNN